MEQVADYEQRLDELMRTKSTLESKIESMEVSHAQLTQKIEELSHLSHTGANDLSVQIRFLKQDCLALKSQLSSVMFDNTEKETLIADRTNLIRKRDDQIKDLKADLERIKTANESEALRVLQLVQNFDFAASVPVTDLFFCFLSKAKENASLRSERSQMERELDSCWQRAKEAFQGESIELQAEMSAIQARVHELQSELTGARAEAARLRGELTHAQDEAIQATAREAHALADKRNAESVLACLQEELNVAQRKSSTLSEHSTAERKRLVSAKDASNVRLLELESVLRSLEEDRAQQEDQIESLVKAQRGLEQERNHFKAASEQAVAQSNHLKNELKTAKETIGNMEASMIMLRQEMDRLKAQIGEANTIAQGRESDSSDLKNKLMICQAELEKERERAGEAVRLSERLRKELDGLNFTEGLERQLIDAYAERDEAKARYNEGLVAQESFRTRIAQLQAKNQQLQLKLKSLGPTPASGPAVNNNNNPPSSVNNSSISSNNTNANSASATNATNGTASSNGTLPVGTPKPANDADAPLSVVSLADDEASPVIVEVCVPPGPIGVKLSKTTPISVLEILTLPGGVESPLAAKVLPGDILFSFDGESCLDLDLQEFQNKMAQNSGRARLLCFQRYAK
eukprot:c10445_g1_i1.p1 GENE.c10445_g1_i1~~c10445_g1_i1.p1  ORF type:complete len:651 (+),score=186.22 c10445_g1_i1:51-1955(+)